VGVVVIAAARCYLFKGTNLLNYACSAGAQEVRDGSMDIEEVGG